MIELRHPLLRPIIATTILATMALGWTAWGSRHANRVMGGDLDTANGKGHFVVTLDFPPESFHTTRLQAIGRVIEVRGSSAYLMDVDYAAMRAFATAYWVCEVRAWQGR